MSPSPKSPEEKEPSNEDTSSNDELSHPPVHGEHEHVASTDESNVNSDDENANPSYDNVTGYCLLPQDFEQNQQRNDYDSENEDEEFMRFATLRSQSGIDEPNRSQAMNSNLYTNESVWTTRLESESFPVDDDKANYIKNLMSTIKLPESSIPIWAQYCSEQDWQEKLRERISCRQTTFFHDEKN